jgi:hypothetical protein
MADGRSHIGGVYTSIPDLMRNGVNRPEEGALRVTLTKLDSDKKPFGTWTAPDFAGLEEACQQFVRTEEFSVDEVNNLARALRSQASAAA